MIKNILAAAAIGVVAMGAQAAGANEVLNGSFDANVASYQGNSYVYSAAPASVTQFYGGTVPTAANPVDDWTGSFVSIAANSGPWNTPSGLSGFDAATQGGFVAGVQADGTLSQALNLAAGEYTLSWTTANRGADQTYSALFAGAQVDKVTTIAGAGWTTESVTFSTLGGTGLSFVGDTSYQNTDATSFIDNVSVTAVPEPASLLMMVVGTLGLLAWRRRAQV